MYKETRMSEVKITDGLIYKKRNIVKEKTIPYIRKALNNELDGVEPSGAFENFRIAAGESDRNFYGLVSQDSDVFKWMEAVAYNMKIRKCKRIWMRQLIYWDGRNRKMDI